MKNVQRLKEQVLAAGAAAGSAASRPAALLFGLAGAVLTLLAGSFALSAAYALTALSAATAHLLQLAVLALAALVGGFVCAKKTGRRGLFSGLLLAFCLFVLLLIWNVTLGGGPALGLALPVKLLALALGGALGGIFGVF